MFSFKQQILSSSSSVQTIVADGREISEIETRRQRKENQAVFQLAVIVGSFMFGYIPTCGGWFVLSIFFKTLAFKRYKTVIVLQLYVFKFTKFLTKF